MAIYEGVLSLNGQILENIRVRVALLACDLHEAEAQNQNAGGDDPPLAKPLFKPDGAHEGRPDDRRLSEGRDDGGVCQREGVEGGGVGQCACHAAEQGGFELWADVLPEDAAPDEECDKGNADPVEREQIDDECVWRWHLPDYAGIDH